jgi:hypothetical protein
VLGRLVDRYALPLAVDKSLGHSLMSLGIGFAEGVEPEPVTERFDLVPVRVDRKLASLANGIGLSPMLLLLETFLEALCSCGVHCVSFQGENSGSVIGRGALDLNPPFLMYPRVTLARGSQDARAGLRFARFDAEDLRPRS